MVQRLAPLNKKVMGLNLSLGFFMGGAYFPMSVCFFYMYFGFPPQSKDMHISLIEGSYEDVGEWCTCPVMDRWTAQGVFLPVVQWPWG